MYLFIGTFLPDESHIQSIPRRTHIEAQLFREVYAASFFTDTTSVGQLKTQVSFLPSGNRRKHLSQRCMVASCTNYDVSTFWHVEITKRGHLLNGLSPWITLKAFLVGSRTVSPRSRTPSFGKGDQPPQLRSIRTPHNIKNESWWLRRPRSGYTPADR